MIKGEKIHTKEQQDFLDLYLDGCPAPPGIEKLTLGPDTAQITERKPHLEYSNAREKREEIRYEDDEPSDEGQIPINPVTKTRCGTVRHRHLSGPSYRTSSRGGI